MYPHGLAEDKTSNYDAVSASFRSASACEVPALLAVLESAFGASAWMDFPKLNLLEPVPVGQVVPAAGAEPVIFAFMHANGTSRLWLTWIADMHWPRFLKPAQASFRSVPAGRRPLDWSFDVSLLSSFVFLLRSVVGELAAPFVDPFTLP